MQEISLSLRKTVSVSRQHEPSVSSQTGITPVRWDGSYGNTTFLHLCTAMEVSILSIGPIGSIRSSVRPEGGELL